MVHFLQWCHVGTVGMNEKEENESLKLDFLPTFQSCIKKATFFCILALPYTVIYYLHMNSSIAVGNGFD